VTRQLLMLCVRTLGLHQRVYLEIPAASPAMNGRLRYSGVLRACSDVHNDSLGLDVMPGGAGKMETF